MSQYNRNLFFSNLIKEAALKSEDIKALQDIFASKYQGHPAARGLAVQYYEKFIKISDPTSTLTEYTLPQPLPPTIDELMGLLRNVVEPMKESKELSKIDPITFLTNFSKEEWAKPDIDAAATKVAESNPIYFLKYFLKEEWAKPYIDTVTHKAAELYPIEFLKHFLGERWARPHIAAAATQASESDPSGFLLTFSGEEWAKPYIPTAASNYAKSNPYEFLYYFSEIEWAEPYINNAAEKVAELLPHLFLQFAERDWARTYMAAAASNVIKIDPYFFLHHFSEMGWAKTKTTTPLGEMSWIEYAKKVVNDLGKTSSKLDNIGVELLKLSNILYKLNFKKESLLIKKLY